MARKPLGTNIEDFRADFESVRGKPFEHFYCPILHVDEQAALTKGHIVPECLGGKSKVLQRTDIDNGFGSFFESEAGEAVLQGFDGNPLDVVLRGDPEEMKKVSRFKVRVRFDQKNQPIDVSSRKTGDQMGLFVARGALEKLLGELDKPTRLRADLGVELDARSSILATSMRTSHLCWFQKCGYRYVFSNEGIHVARVLRSFYENFISPRYGPNKTKKGSLASDQVKSEVDGYCFQFANFIRPWPRSSVETFPEEIQRGTLDSGHFIALWDGNQIYGRISIVKFGSKHFGVMTPIITDPRGWALVDLTANLRLEYSLASLDAEAGVYRVDPSTGHTLIWPSAFETTSPPTSRPVSIREAADIVVRSGRMSRSSYDRAVGYLSPRGSPLEL